MRFIIHAIVAEFLNANMSLGEQGLEKSSAYVLLVPLESLMEVNQFSLSKFIQ